MPTANLEHSSHCIQCLSVQHLVDWALAADTLPEPCWEGLPSPACQPLLSGLWVFLGLGRSWLPEAICRWAVQWALAEWCVLANGAVLGYAAAASIVCRSAFLPMITAGLAYTCRHLIPTPVTCSNEGSLMQHESINVSVPQQIIQSPDLTCPSFREEKRPAVR